MLQLLLKVFRNDGNLAKKKTKQNKQNKTKQKKQFLSS